MIGKNAWTGLLAFAIGSLAAVGPAKAEDGLEILDAIESAFSNAIEKAQPSVVSIFLLDSRMIGANPMLVPGRGLSNDQNDPSDWKFAPLSFGSGVVLDEDGRILTAYHVVRGLVEDSNQRMMVRLHDGRRFAGRIHAADPRSDLAVIALQPSDEPFNLDPIKIADGDKLFRGQFVLAIGNPYAVAAVDGETSASWGIISNIRRRAIPSSADNLSESIQSLQAQRTLIQTDARLNTGISGGALINTRGQLIGVTMALSAAVGFETPGGFALPTNELTRRTIETLRQGKEMEYGFVGIGPDTVTETEAARMGAIATSGALVRQIFQFLPAFHAGLREGDIITHIEGKRIHTRNDLVLAVGSRPVDTVIPMKVVRGQQRLDLKIPLAKFPVNGPIIVSNPRPIWNGIRVDHLSTLAVNISRGVYDDEFNSGGVVISNVEDNSPAFDEGLQKNQVISEVNGESVRHPDDFEKMVAEAEGPVTLTVSDGIGSFSRRREIVFEPPAKDVR